MMVPAELAQLETRGLLRLATVDTNTEYEFRHSLFQEMAYRSLLLEERKQLHGLIGEIVEEVHSGRLASHAARLADHFSQAGRKDKALEYSKLAGSEALRIHAYGEAVNYFRTALEWAQAEPIARAELEQAYLDLGRSLELAAHFDLALETYTAMEEQAEGLADRKMELAAITAQSTLYSTSSPLMDRAKGVQLSYTCLAEAQAIGEPRLEIQAHWNLMLALGSQNGQEGQALTHGEAGLKLANQHREEELRAFLRNDLGRINVFCGNLARGEKLAQEATALWQLRGNKPMLVDSLMTMTLLRLMAGRLDEFPTTAKEARTLANEIGNAWAQAYSLMLHDRFYFVTGSFGRALSSARRALEQGGEIGFFVGMAMANIVLSRILVEMGRPQEAQAPAEEALSILGGRQHPFADEARAAKARAQIHLGDLGLAEKTLSATRLHLEEYGEGVCLPISLIPVRLTKAELDLAKSKFDQSFQSLARLEGRVEARGIRLYIPELLELKGRTLLKMGEVERAAIELRKGLNLAEQIGAKRDLWQLQASLAQVEKSLGRQARASELWKNAREVVLELVESLHGHDDLQDRFMARNSIRKILEAAS